MVIDLLAAIGALVEHDVPCGVEPSVRPVDDIAADTVDIPASAGRACIQVKSHGSKRSLGRDPEVKQLIAFSLKELALGVDEDPVIVGALDDVQVFPA
jgi:hypothetical protein